MPTEGQKGNIKRVATIVYRQVKELLKMLFTVSNIIAAVALYYAVKSEKTALSVDTFVNKTNILISKNTELVKLYSQEIDKIKYLTEKTDSIVKLATIQLSNNEEQQRIANVNFHNTQIGEMNKLYSTAHLINNMKFNMNIIEHTYHNTPNSEFYDNIRKLMVQEMNNSYLNSQTNLNSKWREVCFSLDGYIFRLSQNSLGLPYLEDEMKKSNLKLNSMIFGVVLDVQEFIDSERRKMGIDNQVRKGDIVQVNMRYPNVLYKAIKPGKEYYMFVRISKDSIPNMPDTLESYYPWVQKIK